MTAPRHIDPDPRVTLFQLAATFALTGVLALLTGVIW